MNEEALKVHGTSLWLSYHRVVFSMLHYSFSPNCLSDKTGYLLEIFHGARIYHISNSMKPNFILLSFTKKNFTGNMFENQLEKKNSVFALRNCMG